jgi:hypothetical protein
LEAQTIEGNTMSDKHTDALAERTTTSTDPRDQAHVAGWNACLAKIRATEGQAQTSAAGQWVRCTPHLILAGVNCGQTPRRAGDGTYSHDHFIAHSDPIHATAAMDLKQIAYQLAQGSDEQRDVVLSPGACARLFAAMTTPPDAAQLADSTEPGAPVDEPSVMLMMELGLPNWSKSFINGFKLNQDGMNYLYRHPVAPTAQQSLTAGGAVPDGLRSATMEAWSVLFDHGIIPGTDGMSLAEGIRKALAAAPLPQVQSEAIPDLYIGKWSFSTDEENFSGELDSEQDAIAEATAQGYEKFWVGQCVHPVETLPDAQSIGEIFIEQAEEWASEECGGDDRIFELNDDDTTKLGQMVRDFIKREASVQRYGVTNITLHQPEPDQQPVTPSGALADNDGGVK